MISSEQNTLLKVLSFYIIFLAGAVSTQSGPVFCELLIGSMLSGEGFLTQALLAIQYDKVWSNYHHWVASGHWRWRSLVDRLLLLDSWFMNKTLMLPALDQGYEIIRNIPKNRALYALPLVALPPSPIKKRGRKAQVWCQNDP